MSPLTFHGSLLFLEYLLISSLFWLFQVQNLVKFDHTVLKAFSPYFAGQFFVRNKTDGWKSLGGILLAFTGVEALFADLGAFSRRYTIKIILSASDTNSLYFPGLFSCPGSALPTRAYFWPISDKPPTLVTTPLKPHIRIPFSTLFLQECSIRLS